MTVRVSAPVATTHFGVYGALHESKRLVTIRRARGPYTGGLDFPGGTPEPGERQDETLRRELAEEVGVRVRTIHLWHPFAFHVTRSSGGDPIVFTHRGIVAVVDVADEVAAVVDDEDVSEVVLMEPTATSGVTPAVRMALNLLAE